MMTLIKWLLPSNKKMAGYVADGIANAINSQAEREAQIARVATIADKVTEYQKFVTQVLTDGKISPEETEQIAEKLLPVVEYIMGKI